MRIHSLHSSTRWRLAAGIALAATLLAACGPQTAPPAPPPPEVGVIAVQPRDVPLVKDMVGRLSPFLSANVTARVSGVLQRRTYVEGANVRQGQVLFEIDPGFYRAQLENALAVLAQDQATLANARVTAARNRQLLPVGSVSQQTVDNSDAAERSAAARVRADEAAVATARLNLGYTKVTSPIDGIAGQQQLTVGAVVGNGTSDGGANGTLLATVQQIDPLYVNFTVSADELMALRQAQAQGRVSLAQQNRVQVKVRLPNGAPYEHPGTLDFTAAVVNAATGAVNLRARLPNPQQALLPGLYVTLSAELGEQKQVFLVPQRAILRDTAGAYALVVGPDAKVLRKNVQAGTARGSDWIVTSGLAAGDRVIVSGLQGAAPGREVKASDWQPPPPAPVPVNVPAPAPAAPASAPAR